VPRLLARAVRWSLPAALLIAALVAASGLRGLLFTGPSDAARPSSIALDLNSPPSGRDAPLTPQGIDVPVCREPAPRCAPSAGSPAAEARTGSGTASGKDLSSVPGCCP
jgi:hypothetical protein